jgi:hypothetical protein
MLLKITNTDLCGRIEVTGVVISPCQIVDVFGFQTRAFGYELRIEPQFIHLNSFSYSTHLDKLETAISVGIYKSFIVLCFLAAFDNLLILFYSFLFPPFTPKHKASFKCC